MDAKTLLAQHAAEYRATCTKLATDFDHPAQRIINVFFQRIGVTRFTAKGDDLWEMLVCEENGWKYKRPPRKLIARWMLY